MCKDALCFSIQAVSGNIPLCCLSHQISPAKPLCRLPSTRLSWELGESKFVPARRWLLWATRRKTVKSEASDVAPRGGSSPSPEGCPPGPYIPRERHLGLSLAWLSFCWNFAWGLWWLPLCVDSPWLVLPWWTLRLCNCRAGRPGKPLEVTQKLQLVMNSTSLSVYPTQRDLGINSLCNRCLPSTANKNVLQKGQSWVSSGKSTHLRSDLPGPVLKGCILLIIVQHLAGEVHPLQSSEGWNYQFESDVLFICTGGLMYGVFSLFGPQGWLSKRRETWISNRQRGLSIYRLSKMTWFSVPVWALVLH